MQNVIAHKCTDEKRIMREKGERERGRYEQPIQTILILNRCVRVQIMKSNNDIYYPSRCIHIQSKLIKCKFKTNQRERERE